MKRKNENSLTEFLPMINRSAILRSLMVCAALFATPAVSLSETIVFSNFGPGNSYNTNLGNFVGNDFAGDVAAEGDTFVPGSSVHFSSLDIALSCFGHGLCADDFTASLNQDNGGVPGTTVLESFTVHGSSLGLLGVKNPPLVLTSVLSPFLTAGTPYWVTVSSDVNNSIVWNWNSTSDPSSEVFSPNAEADWFALGFTPGAYQVNASSITTPEPSTLVLLVFTMLPLLGLRNFSAVIRSPTQKIPTLTNRGRKVGIS
jgi:hypothetical protein